MLNLNPLILSLKCNDLHWGHCFFIPRMGGESPQCVCVNRPMNRPCYAMLVCKQNFKLNEAAVGEI